MGRRATLVLATALFLAGCATQPLMKEFAGAIKNAKQAGRPLVIFRVYRVYRVGGSLREETQDISLGRGARPAVDIITTSKTTLKSISFEFLRWCAANAR
jgi:hypothetical protein